MNNFPLQANNNSCAYSYWVALRVSLQIIDPYRKLNFTVLNIEKIVSTSNITNGIYLDKITRAFPSFGFRELFTMPFNCDYPIAITTWTFGKPQALCLLPNTLNKNPGYGYDPKYGSTDRIIDITRCSNPVKVICRRPEKFPYAKWYWRFALGRFLIKPELYK